MLLPWSPPATAALSAAMEWTACEDELAAALIDASAEFGDISTEIREATKDRKVCERDQARITLQIDEALASLGRLRAVVNACGKDA